MINHDCVFEKTLITQNFFAESDVSALRYDKNTFTNIFTQFADIADDLEIVCRDRNDLEINKRFLEDTLRDGATRQIIINHYNELVAEEKNKAKKLRKSNRMKKGLLTSNFISFINPKNKNKKKKG